MRELRLATPRLSDGAEGELLELDLEAPGGDLVVAAARDAAGLERARSLGADATVDLSGPDVSERLIAVAPAGFDVILDPLWGEPLAAALPAAAPNGRIVTLGIAAGPLATLTPAMLGKNLSLLAYNGSMTPPAVLRDGYARVARPTGTEEAGDLDTEAAHRAAGAEDEHGLPRAQARRSASASHAVTPATPSAAAWASDTSSGMSTADASATTARSANVPPPSHAMRVPGASASPSTTRPAPSTPGTKGQPISP